MVSTMKFSLVFVIAPTRARGIKVGFRGLTCSLNLAFVLCSVFKILFVIIEICFVKVKNLD